MHFLTKGAALLLSLSILSACGDVTPDREEGRQRVVTLAESYEPFEPWTMEPPTTTTPPPPPPTTTTTHYHPPVTQPPAPKPASKPASARVTPAPSSTAQPTGNCGGWEGLISAYFPGEVAKACSVMMCESLGNPGANNASSSASGLWQFLSGTWETITGTPAPASQYSAETQTAAAAKLRNSSGWGQWSCS